MNMPFKRNLNFTEIYCAYCDNIGHVFYDCPFIENLYHGTNACSSRDYSYYDSPAMLDNIPSDYNFINENVYENENYMSNNVADLLAKLEKLSLALD